MKKVLLISAGVFFGFVCLTACGGQEYTEPDPSKIDSVEDLQAYFAYNPNRDIVISAHRGGMQPGYPENCIETCEHSLATSPAYFEIDFSFTKDSVMVLMHDLTLDRTTTGKGNICDYTYEEIQQFNLVDRDGNVTPYKIPTLMEMLEWGDHKAVFNFDNKYINTAGVSEEQKRVALEYYAKQLLPGGDWNKYHNIQLSVRSLEEAMFYWDKGIRNVTFCVEISSYEMYEAYEASPIPWSYLVAYVGGYDLDPELYDLYNKLHENGVMVFTSITGAGDKMKSDRNRRIAYFQYLLSEPDIIETDYPSEFADLPKSRAEIRAVAASYKK